MIPKTVLLPYDEYLHGISFSKKMHKPLLKLAAWQGTQALGADHRLGRQADSNGMCGLRLRERSLMGILVAPIQT